jgi:hypothetical protein
MNWLKMNNKCDQETGLRGNDELKILVTYNL